MAQMTMIQAITDALRTELRNDPNVLVFGEDVGEKRWGIPCHRWLAKRIWRRSCI